MPVILPPLSDPTDYVLAGEQLRQSTFGPQDASDVANMFGGSSLVGFDSQVTLEDQFPPMNSFVEVDRVNMRRNKSGERLIRVNAGLATPCGAWISVEYGDRVLRPELFWASARFAISGVTKDSAGTPLAGCRVVCHETGRLALAGLQAEQNYSAGNPSEAGPDPTGSMVGETVSDGGGNYTIPVALNTAHQLTAYKAGSPDVAGITRNDVVPAQAG